MLLFAWPLLLCLASDASGAFQQTRFVIGGGPDPPPTNDSYANLHRAGVTFLHADSNEVTSLAAAQQMAVLCATNNLSCVLPLVSVKAVAPDGRSVWGFFLRDEPKARDFKGLAKEVASVRKLHPHALSFINLLGYVNSTAYPDKAKAIYGVDTYQEYVDAFLSSVRPDVLIFDHYPEYSSMDGYHYNLNFMRNRSLTEGVPLWNYVWLSSNGRGHGAGFYRWQLFIAAAYGSKGMMQWSVSPCADIHNCGPKSRWAPFPCLLDKHGDAFKPVFNMARIEHQKLLSLGPLLIALESQQVVRLFPTRATPIVTIHGMPLKSISTGPWLLGHFRQTLAASPTLSSSGFDQCVMIVNDDPINTAFPSIDLGAGGAVAVREVAQETGALVPVNDDAPDVAGFQLFFEEGGGRLFCWGVNSTAAGLETDMHVAV